MSLPKLDKSKIDFKIEPTDFDWELVEDFMTGDICIRWVLKTEAYRKMLSSLARAAMASGISGKLQCDYTLSTPRGSIGFRLSERKEVMPPG